MKYSNAIFKERAVEFANEGLRDSDLRRWQLSHTMLNREEYGLLVNVCLPVYSGKIVIICGQYRKMK